MFAIEQKVIKLSNTITSFSVYLLFNFIPPQTLRDLEFFFDNQDIIIRITANCVYKNLFQDHFGFIVRVWDLWYALITVYLLAMIRINKDNHVCFLHISCFNPLTICGDIWIFFCSMSTCKLGHSAKLKIDYSYPYVFYFRVL